MPRIAPDQLKDGYDLVLVGTGFGSLFFLAGYLAKRPRARVLLLEWGSYLTSDWQRAHQANSDIDTLSTFVKSEGEKLWNYTIAYGGGTNCWWAQTPRLSPADMQLKSRYGVAEDWPLSYEQIEPYYCDAEAIMQVAGQDALGLHYPMSRPFPQPQHNLSTADKIMAAASPELHFAAPTARLTLPQPGRAACCDTARCHLCPVEAKFTALNSLGHLIEAENVDLLVNARVRQVETEAGRATGVMFETGGTERRVKGELIGLGANGIQTPFILLQSGFRHPVLGRYLHEKFIAVAEVYLDGLDHFDGGTPITGMNMSLLAGVDRSEAAGALIYLVNEWRHGLRSEYGRWRQTMPIELMVEDIPQLENGVFDEGGDFPVVRHGPRSEYCMKGVERALARLPEILGPLPVERIVRRDDVPTASHVQGTCRMGADPATSIVDRDLIHHEVRNLMVLGTAVWPSCGPANPSLTAAALSLRAADRIGSA